MTEQYAIVDTIDALEKLARRLKHEPVIACDLEADSMYHYREKVCLLQMATPRFTSVIDPLAIHDMAPLNPFFSNDRIRKVFHGADYDVRSLFRDFRIEIRNLFDTELACRFLGARATGLDAVLKKEFGVELNKKFQKSDWSQRPLPEEMLLYAASDTAHLVALSDLLIAQLHRVGRLAWVEEECEILSRVRPTAADTLPLYMRFRGAGRLNRRNLAVLEALLQYRQEIARKRDKPLFKVIGNDALMKIVVSSPMQLQDLKKCGVLSKTQLSMFGQDLVRIIAETADMPAKDLPVYPRQKAPKLNPSVPQRIKRIKEWRDDKARMLKINPALLFSKSQMTSIAKYKPTRLQHFESLPDIRKWQQREFGTEIIALLKTSV